MGNIARTGILGGKPVSVANFARYDESVLSEDLLWRTLDRAGVRLIAEHISRGDVLTEGEIEHLLRNVQLPVLMKLSELVRYRQEITPQKLNNRTNALIPIYVISNRYSHMVGEKDPDPYSLRAGIEKHYQPGLHLYCGGIHFNMFESGNVSLFSEICRDYSGVVPVAPAFETLKRDIWRRFELEADEVKTTKLIEFLVALKKEGFDTLHSVSTVEDFQLLCDLGFSTVYRYGLDTEMPIEEHIQNLFELKNLVTKNVLCGWEIYPSAFKNKRKAVFMESEALRFLAVGCLTLRNVDWHIVSSQFFSVEALQLSCRLGANCLGYGAVDENTARVLGIEMFQKLESLIVPDEDDRETSLNSDNKLVFQ